MALAVNARQTMRVLLRRMPLTFPHVGKNLFEEVTIYPSRVHHKRIVPISTRDSKFNLAILA